MIWHLLNALQRKRCSLLYRSTHNSLHTIKSTLIISQSTAMPLIVKVSLIFSSSFYVLLFPCTKRIFFSEPIYPLVWKNACGSLIYFSFWSVSKFLGNQFLPFSVPMVLRRLAPPSAMGSKMTQAWPSGQKFPLATVIGSRIWQKANKPVQIWGICFEFLGEVSLLFYWCL